MNTRYFLILLATAVFFQIPSFASEPHIDYSLCQQALEQEQVLEPGRNTDPGYLFRGLSIGNDGSIELVKDGNARLVRLQRDYFHGKNPKSNSDWSLYQSSSHEIYPFSSFVVVHQGATTDESLDSDIFKYPATGTGIPWFGSRFHSTTRIYLDELGRISTIRGLEHGRGRLIRKGKAYTWNGSELNFIYAPSSEGGFDQKCLLQRKQATASGDATPEWLPVIDLQVCRGLDHFFSSHPDLLACRFLQKSDETQVLRRTFKGLEQRGVLLVPSLPLSRVSFDDSAIDASGRLVGNWSQDEKQELYDKCSDPSTNESVSGAIRGGEKHAFMSSFTFPNSLAFAAVHQMVDCSNPIMQESVREADLRFGPAVSVPFRSRLSP